MKKKRGARNCKRRRKKAFDDESETLKVGIDCWCRSHRTKSQSEEKTFQTFFDKHRQRREKIKTQKTRFCEKSERSFKINSFELLFRSSWLWLYSSENHFKVNNCVRNPALLVFTSLYVTRWWDPSKQNDSF